MRKFLSKQIHTKGRLIIGIAGAVVVHAGFWFSQWALTNKPSYEVVVSPSVLEVALVKPKEEKKKEVKPPPEPKKEPSPVEKPEEIIEEPEIVQPEQESEKPEPEPELEEPEIEPVEDPEPEPESEPEPVEEIEHPEKEEEAEPEEVNVRRGAIREAEPLERINQPPRYPRKARRRGWEGRVILFADIDKQGNVDHVRVKQTSGYKDLDEAAVKAIRRWQFEPARRFGQPVSSGIEIPVVFRLKEGV